MIEIAANLAFPAFSQHAALNTILKAKSAGVLHTALPPSAVVREAPLVRSVGEVFEGHIAHGSPGRHDSGDALFVGDLGEVYRQHVRWKALLPRVETFYAVKCNPDPAVIKLLADLGTSFDCASMTEIQMVLDTNNVDPSRIIYANPCKQASHIAYASSVGVRMMTFDNKDELYKIRRIAPDAQLVLRILTDDSKSLCKLGTKFGASLDCTGELLATARELGLNIIGVSFHVGSGCFEAQAFGDAVMRAKYVFDQGREYGYNFTLLDVGGGFPGNGVAEGITFPEIAGILGPAIDRYFPPSVRVIAEPGRYYVSSAFTLAVNVTSRRSICNLNANGVAGDDSSAFMYYVNDGVYGSFNCLMFDHATVYPRILARNGVCCYDFSTSAVMNISPEEREYNCSIWGPTCDSIDCIIKKCSLPKLEVGDWICFENMGAYTMCAASVFNGFQKTAIQYINSEVAVEI